MKRTWSVLFWVLLVVLTGAVMVLGLIKMDESLRWAWFAGFFITAVFVCVLQTVRHDREKRAQQRIREEHFQDVILIEAREAQRARTAAAVEVRRGQASSRRVSPAPRSTDTASPPSSAFDPAYPVSGFEFSPGLGSLFNPPPSCDASPPDSSSSYDGSDSSSSCNTDTSSSSGGGDW